jgi:thiamine pyrophosphate-dependent acetolactate synthase large subunit-like protein/nitrite reductase/ring-hydroxylating ferredoxin subunit
MSSGKRKQVWEKVLDRDELAEGRVKPVTCRHRTVCMTRFEGTYAALDNRCPHQAGPLGEGSIENGWLRCPWHGWDFHPTTGRSPGEHDDGVETFPVEERDDGVYVAFPVEDAHVRTVSDVVAASMANWGVRWVFGMVGHSNLGLADAIRRQVEAGTMRYVGIRHEGAASFACSAYGKLTGRPAACLAIAGPGATNLLTGLWDANVDRAPVLALTGQVDTQVLGPGAFQEIDLQAAFGGVAQWSQTVLPDSRHGELVNIAARSAILNRGVSHLVFPDEVQTRPAPDGATPGGPDGRITPREIVPPADALDRAVEALASAKRPVFVVGHGARFHVEDVYFLAEQVKAPVLTTFKGKGLVSDRHPLGCGVLGRSGTPIASWFMNEADLLVVWGASFSNHTGINPKIPTVHVDFDPVQIGRFHRIEYPLWGEIGATARLLNERLAGRDLAATDVRDEIAERWAIWRREKERRLGEERGRGVSSAAVFAAMTRQVPEDAILSVDVGNNTYSFGRYFECSDQAVLMSGYLGSIGFGLPGALGAWAATQEPGTRFRGRKVVSVSGDGGFGQYLAEWTTAVKYGMDVTHVLLNNAELGKISKEQRAGDWDVWETSLANPEFARYSELCGGLGIRVTEAADLDDALARALAHEGPALVEVVTAPDLV